MRLVQLLAALALSGLDACESASSPTGPPTGDLEGAWGWTGNGNPGGSWLTITLSTAGSVVTGTGVICGIGPHCNPGPVTITGLHIPEFGPFTLIIKGGGSYGATYAGQFVGFNELRGTWTEGSQSYPLIVSRCTPTTFC